MRCTSTLTLGLVLALFGACAKPEPPLPSPGATPAPAALGTVEVTNYPLQYVVERLAAPLVVVGFRAARTADPAHWRPTAEDVIAMQAADLIVVNGASYESWMKDVSLPASRVVDSTGALGDRLIAVAGKTTHSHGLQGEHEHQGTAFTTWLDPTLLLEQVRSVRAALGHRWPEHDDLFGERMVALEADLAALDQELKEATSNAAGHRVVFSHPVYQYLQRRYDMVGTNLHWEPGEAPDEASWSELDHLLGHVAASVMIWEAVPLAETVDRLAERGVECVVVDPCATPPGDGGLLEVMHENAARLRRAFGG